MTTAASLILDTARRRELHHAVILHGPAPIALQQLSLHIAKALNCLQGTTGDDCTACDRIERRMHPDVHYVEVTGERKMISIEQIREIVAEASLRPYEGSTKVFILDPAEAVSPSGLNSLLKTLEEPARDTTFLLLTRSPDLLLPTIRSRSQSIYVGPPKSTEARGSKEAARLEQFAAVEGSAELAGRVLDALHRYAANGESAMLLALAGWIAAEENTRDALAILAAVLCDAVGLDPADSVAPEKLAAVREAIPREKLLAAADGAMAAVRGLTVNADVRMAVEKALAALL